MKAIRFHTTGNADVLRYEDVDRPEPTDGQVRIRVAASAFNPADGGLRGGFLPIPITLPHTPGYDASGTVDAIGAGVTGFELGDEVIGFLPMTDDGAAAQYVIAPADALVKAPTAIDLSDAAGLPSVGLTAWQSLFEAAELASGQRILINGASGPVGGYAVQLAKQAGAHVTATASPSTFEAVRAAGADDVIDYTTTSVLEADFAPVDVLLNLAPITEDGFVTLAQRVRDGGVVVSTTPMVPTPDDPARGVRGVTIFVHPDVAVLTDLVRRVDAGELHVDIARRIPLEELPTLHAQADGGQARGKVVVIPPAL